MSAVAETRPHVRRPHDTAALARIDSHEKVCLVRWEQILKRMDRIEHIVVGTAGTLILGMAGLLATLLMRGHP